MQSAARTSPAKPRHHQRLGNFLLILGSILFFWVAIELPAALNIFDYQGLEYNQVWGNLRFIRVPDPELLHIEPPHAHYAGSSRGGEFEMRYAVPPAEQTLYRWDLRYDAHGFRNAVDLERADIAVIGDSMVEAMTVPEDRIATSLLARSTGRTVANLGQYGFGPQQEFAVLRRYALPLHPKTIFWVFSEGTDVDDEIEYREIREHPPGPVNFFLQRSFTRFAIRSVRRMMAGSRPPGAVRSGIFQTPSAPARSVYFSAVARPLDAAQIASVARIAAMIAHARDLASQSGADLVFVYIPDKFRAMRGACRFPSVSECSAWRLSDLPARLRSAILSASPGIGYVDLTPALAAAAAARGVLPYYTDDVHLSEDGQRIAAEGLENYLDLRRTGTPRSPVPGANAAQSRLALPLP